MGEKSRGHGPLIGALDQGTSSTRFLVFVAETGQLVTYHQLPIQTQHPEEGWVEQDPQEILESVVACIDETCAKLEKLNVDPWDIKAIGIANQRETTIVWDRQTGQPLYPAIVWSDTRTSHNLHQIIQRMPPNRANRFCLLEKCGLPLSPYFSALKLRWLLENVESVQKARDSGQLLFGTVDSWLMWNLTGRRAHLTDVTNASRTMLMDIRTLDWDPFLLQFFDVPRAILPEIRSSAELFGRLHLSWLGSGASDAAGGDAGFGTSVGGGGVPIAGCLGDQQAALLGQHCLAVGQTKATYGTGCFLLTNTGTMPVISSRGLLTTVAFRLGPAQPAVYALEGSIGQAGAALDWLRSVGIEAAAAGGSNSDMSAASGVGGGVLYSPKSAVKAGGGAHGVHVVPAFGGLLAPRWRPDARATITGISHFTEARHIVRATLEAIAYQRADGVHGG